MKNTEPSLPVNKRRKNLERWSTVPFFLWMALFSADQARAEDLLTWKDCVLEAKKNHPDLVSATEKLNQSKASKTSTASGLFPQVSGSVDASTTKVDSTSRSSSSSSSSSVGRTNSYSYAVSGKQLVFDGFKTYFDVEQAAKNIEASRYNYDVTSSNVRLRLRTAFVDLLKAQALLDITQDIAKRRLQSRDLIQLRYNVGREHKGSLLTAEANLAQADFEVEKAKRNIGLAQRQLSKELGRTKLLAPFKLNGDFVVADKVSSKPDFENLAETVPLLRELVVEKEAAKWGVKSAIGEFFPQIFVSAATERTGHEWLPAGRDWSAGASLTVPFFEGGNLVAGAAKAQAEYRQAEADEKSGRDGVILTMEDAWTQFQDALGQAAVEQKFLEAAQERAKIAESEYSAGLITFNDWIIIEDNLVSTQKTFLDDQAETLLAEAAWLQAKGETLDAD